MKEVFKINRETWNEIGQKAIQLERTDIRKKGIFQNDSRDTYRSKKYVKYKANDMRKFGRGKKKKGAGDRLKNYKGISITSNNVRFVDLTLTGSMLNNMYQTPINNGVQINFAPKDAGKVLGAEDMGRVVLTLRDKNITILEDLLDKNIDKNFRKLRKTNLTIIL